MSPVADPADREPSAGFPRSRVRCDRLYESEWLAQVLRPIRSGVLPYDPDLSDHRVPYAELEPTVPPPSQRD